MFIDIRHKSIFTPKKENSGDVGMNTHILESAYLRVVTFVLSCLKLS